MLNALTSLRFFAAFLVFAEHTLRMPAFHFGATGVSFFFVLSGFILTYTYDSKLQNLKKINILKFYAARFAKIYPLHLLTFLLAAPFAVVGLMHSNSSVLEFFLKVFLNMTLLQTYVPQEPFYWSFNSVSWTLSNEMFFYLMFPVVIAILRKVYQTTTTKVFILGVTLVWVILTTVVGLLPQGNFVTWFIHILPLFRILDFGTGVVLGLVFLKRNTLDSDTRHSSSFMTVLEACGILAIVAEILMAPYISENITLGLYYLPTSCFVIYVFALDLGHISRLLSSKILIFLGEISFAFYMIHALVLSYLRILYPSHSLITAFTITLIGSALVYLVYEEPLRKRIRSILNMNLDSTKRQTKTSIIQSIRTMMK